MRVDNDRPRHFACSENLENRGLPEDCELCHDGGVRREVNEDGGHPKRTLVEFAAFPSVLTVH